MIEGQLPCFLATVLAGMPITPEDLNAGQLSLETARPLDH
jgi:hypothetical protein